MLRFAERLDTSFTPQERLALVDALWREPVAELRRQGLLSEAALIEAVENLDSLRAGTGLAYDVAQLIENWELRVGIVQNSLTYHKRSKMMASEMKLAAHSAAPLYANRQNCGGSNSLMPAA